MQVVLSNERENPDRKIISDYQFTNNILTPNSVLDSTRLGLYFIIATVALLAKSGGCSTYEKAMVAASLIHPSNNVAYLIVEDSSKRPIKTLSLENELEALPKENESQLPYFSDTLMKFLPEQDGESFVSVESMEFDLESAQQHGRALLELPKPEWNTADENENAQLETNSNQLSAGLLEINIALLRVSYGTGEAMFDILDNDFTLEKLKGGPQILLNGNGSSFGARTVLFWMLVTFSICACGCGCLIICVQTELDEPEEPQPRRPVRRRLTLEEVRSRFPSYHFHPEDHTQNGCCPSDGVCTSSAAAAAADVGYMQVSDECTICLDEFEQHVRVRKLPCGHVFHSTCIARWLVERHANCPLCKLDLYIEPEVEEDDEHGGSENNDASPQSEPPTAASFWNAWFTNSNSNTEGYSQLEVPSGAVEQAEGLSPSGAVQEEPRSWWPFSLETVPSGDEDESNNNNNDGRSSPLALSSSIAAGALSSLWARNSSFFSRQRRRHTSSQDGTESNLTELTEPLVPAASASSTPEEEPAEGILVADARPSSLTQEEESQPLVLDSAISSATSEI